MVWSSGKQGGRGWFGKGVQELSLHEDAQRP